MKKPSNSVIVIVVLVILVIFGVGRYNKLVKKDEKVNQSWAQVENVYQRRADLIPNLVSTVKGVANFEKSTLTQVIEARAKATSVNVNADKLSPQAVNQFEAAQGQLTSALSRLMVVVERYPELKANQNFLELQAQLEGTENRIAVERKRFNDAVMIYNNTIRTFPGNLYASVFGFDKKGYFAASEGAEEAPKVEF
ncbi:MAG TPA: LemA family protein [Bacteroidales bacterium]|nr:LemA family protein [Bacteroidales bacterium]